VLAAAGAAPAISTPFVSRAMADTKALSIVQWSHFVPAYDRWFDKFAKDWGTQNNVQVTVDHIPVQDVAARGCGGVGRIGTRPVWMERRRRRASLPQVPRRHDEPGRGGPEKIRQGHRNRRLTRMTTPGPHSPTITSTSR
jgi:hypothetical protein